jgi:cytochrome c5
MKEKEFACADCGKPAPPADEGEAITKKHGWRISRTVIDGVAIYEARCRECHARTRTSIPPTMAGRRDPKGG